MTRYESIIITALLTVFLGVMCIPDLSNGAYALHRKRPPPPIQCTAMQDKFYVRNRCGSQGFVSVSARNKVIVQQTGLNTSHPAVAIMKETCTVNFTTESPWSWKRRPRLYSEDTRLYSEDTRLYSEDTRLYSEEETTHFVRYRHHKSKRYICFNPSGKVKAVSKRRVEKKGSLCLFEEKRLDKSFHTIRSMYNPSWHLAFNYRRPYKESGNKALPSRNGQGSNSRRCDAQFHSGKVEPPVGLRHAFSGIFDQILQSDDDSNTNDNTSQQPSHNVHNHINETISKLTTNDDSTVNRAVTNHDTQLSNKMLHQSPSQNMIPDSQYAAVNLQNVWAVTTRPQPKMRHIANKRPRLSRAQKNRIKKMRRYKARKSRKLSNYSATRGKDTV